MRPFVKNSAPNPPSGERRKTALIGLIVGTAVLFAVVFSQQWFFLSFLQPGGAQTLTFAALSALIFLLLVTLIFILFRNLVKLFAERRGGVVGSKFRTRMVIGALVISFTPVIFLFLFAYGLMNRSINTWFSQPVNEVRQDTLKVTQLLERYAAEDAQLEAQSVAALPEVQRAFEIGSFGGVIAELRRHSITLKGGFALALQRSGEGQRPEDWSAEAAFNAPDAWSALRTHLPLAALQRDEPQRFMLNGRPYMLASSPAGDAGRIVVAMPLPQQFTATLQALDNSQKNYQSLYAQRKLVQRTYLGYLLLLTVLVLFVATWFALFLSRLVTRPVTALADAMEEISRGRLEARVQLAAADELGDLVSSFNAMAADLQSQRQRAEASSRDLGAANQQLEQRRRQIETILESIPTGVLSLDAELRIAHANDAFTRMFRADASKPGAMLKAVFPADVAADLGRLIRKSERMGTSISQFEIVVAGSRLDVAVTVAALQHDRQRLGYVVVFEDLSDVLRAQKQAAWREVARRVAHEIKNPLTPIALSAERIQRHLQRGTAPDPSSLAVIEGCASTIAGAVETVRTLVDEFSTLARFPSAQPQPTNINQIIENALNMFNGRLDGINVSTHFTNTLPRVMADPEAMKRAVANLVDNAAEAMQQSLIREIHISTSLLASRDMVEVVVADSGHGISAELKEKLFLPYFSTKQRGTGLGLAIVSRIVEEHRGSIRVEENAPIGARFVIELPVATEGAAASA